MPTVVELPRVERSEQAKSKKTLRVSAGIWLEISVACRRDVAFAVESHPNSAPYPIVAIAPRFCSVIPSAKLRLRASPSAQNDIQRFCLLFVVSQRQTTFLADRVLEVPSRSRQHKRTLRSRRPSIHKLTALFRYLL